MRLRSDFLGLLDEGVKLADRFIDKGIIQQTIGHGGEKYLPYLASIFFFVFSNLSIFLASSSRFFASSAAFFAAAEACSSQTVRSRPTNNPPCFCLASVSVAV